MSRFLVDRQHAKEPGLHQIVRVTEIVGDVTPADLLIQFQTGQGVG